MNLIADDKVCGVLAFGERELPVRERDQGREGENERGIIFVLTFVI